MAGKIVGLLSPGDMGHGVGAFMTGKGHRVLTDLTGRSDLTRARAERSGIEDRGSLEAIAGEAELVLSILPPDRAEPFARDMAAAMAAAGVYPAFVDCNAISPATTVRIKDIIEGAGAVFQNAGIIGSHPGKPGTTKFYTSGPAPALLDFLHDEDAGVSVRPLGEDIAAASAIKMCYAGLTKGMMTLHTGVLMAAELLGVGEALHTELAQSQKWHWEAMNKRVPFYAADAGRWAAEMEEIADTLGAAGVTDKMHRGAAEVFRLLDASPLGAESRETADPDRTLDEALAIYTEAVRAKKAAE